MATKQLNKKKLQAGGNPNPAIKDIVVGIKQALEMGVQPEQVILELLNQNVPDDDINNAFIEIGFPAEEVSNIIQTIRQPKQEEQQVPQFQQFGGQTLDGSLYNSFNPLPKPQYIPAIPRKPDLFGAAQMLDDTFSSFFSGRDQNKDGNKDGVFRDFGQKVQSWHNSKPYQYDYEMILGPTDTNKYKFDVQDLYKGEVPTMNEWLNNVLQSKSVKEELKCGGGLKKLKKAQYGFENVLNDPNMSYLYEGQPINVPYLNPKELPAKNMLMSPADVFPDSPQVNKNLNLNKAADRFMNHPGMQMFGAIGGAGVGGAAFANEWFANKEYMEYDSKLRDLTMGDRIFQTMQDPKNKQGYFDINTGLAPLQLGGENTYYQSGGEIIDVDINTITKLLAEGADIEML